MHFDHVGISVGDIETMATWYEKALGVVRTHPFTVPPIEMTGVFLIDGNGLAIELVHRPHNQAGMDASNPAVAALTRGYSHLCLRVEDVDALYDHLLSVGGESAMAPQESPEPGVRFAWIRDPEGNLIEFHDRKHPVI